MAPKTPYADLYKWDKTDTKLVTIQGVADNAEKIDTKLKSHNDSITAVEGRVTTVEGKVTTVDKRVDDVNTDITTKVKPDIANVKNQLDSIILASGTSDAETVQARGTFPILKDRLNSVDTQLASIENDSSLYLMSGFRTDSETLNLWSSANGVKWNHLGSVYTAPSGMVRDPSIQRYKGKYYIVYSTGWANNYFGLASSPDLINWTFITHIYVNPTYDKAWAPELFIDDDGSMHVFITCSLTGTSTFKLVELHPMNEALTTWSAPVQLSGNFANNVIDAYMLKKDGQYCIWYKNEDTKYIEYAKSTNMLTGYVVQGSGDWAGWGANLEGESVVKLPDGTWRIYFDSYNDAKYYYSDSVDWVTWTPKQLLVSDKGIRHCSVLIPPSATKDLLYVKNFPNHNLIDLNTLATGGIINSLVATKNTIYYVNGTNNVEITDIDISNLNHYDEIGFVVFSDSLSSFITLKPSATVRLPSAYKISIDNYTNENLLKFVVIKNYLGTNDLRALGDLNYNPYPRQIDLNTLATGGVITSLVAEKNTVYYVKDTNNVEINNIDISKLRHYDEIAFIVFSQSTSSFIKINPSATVKLPATYKISTEQYSNENLEKFVVIKNYLGTHDLRLLGDFNYNSELKQINLNTLATGGVIAQLSVNPNTIYFVSVLDNITINNISTVNVKSGEKFYFACQSGEPTAGITIKNTVTAGKVYLPKNLDYVISFNSGNNDAYIPFMKNGVDEARLLL